MFGAELSQQAGKSEKQSQEHAQVKHMVLTLIRAKTPGNKAAQRFPVQDFNLARSNHLSSGFSCAGRYRRWLQQ
jgi:hypothetical protein